MKVLLVASNPERRTVIAGALRNAGLTVLAVRGIADIERWPKGDVVVTEAGAFSEWWTYVGAAHVVVLADTPAQGENARRRGAIRWFPSHCAEADLSAWVLQCCTALFPAMDHGQQNVAPGHQ